MSFGTRLQEARMRIGLSRDDLAAAIGVSRSAVSNYENEISHPKESVMYKLFDALRVDANYLFQDELSADSCFLTTSGHRIGRAYEKAAPPVQRTVEVALEPYMEKDDPLDNIIKVDFSQSEQRASAGTGVYLGDECMITIKVRADVLPTDYQRNPERYFGVPVEGDSMEPKYHNDDVLIVSKEPVNVGQIGIFTMDGEGYVKELGRGVLHSLNPDYDDIPLTEDVRCNGKVVGVLDPRNIFDE